LSFEYAYRGRWRAKETPAERYVALVIDNAEGDEAHGKCEGRLVNGEQTGRHLLTLMCNDWPTERVNLLATTSSWVETDRWGGSGEGDPT